MINDLPHTYDRPSVAAPDRKILGAHFDGYDLEAPITVALNPVSLTPVSLTPLNNNEDRK